MGGFPAGAAAKDVSVSKNEVYAARAVFVELAWPARRMARQMYNTMSSSFAIILAP
jgi:hypothetical protein